MSAAIAPWVLPMIGGPVNDAVYRQAQAVAAASGWRVFAWQSGDPSNVEDVVTGLLETHIRQGCGIEAAVLPVDPVAPGRPVVLTKESLWPGTWVEVDGKRTPGVRAERFGNRLEFRLPAGFEPGTPVDVRVFRPGARDAVLPAAVTPSDPDGVAANRRIIGAERTRSGIAVDWTISELRAEGEPLIDASSELAVEIAGEVVAKAAHPLLLPATLCGDASAPCEGSCSALCPESPVRTELTLELEDGTATELIIFVTPRIGAVPDPQSDDDSYVLTIGGETSTRFVRGDCNADTSRDLSDGIAVFGFLFLGSLAPTCADACDSNDDGTLDITDGVLILNHLFLSGPAPRAPFPHCGEDPTPDDRLDCDVFRPCS